MGSRLVTFLGVLVASVVGLGVVGVAVFGVGGGWPGGSGSSGGSGASSDFPGRPGKSDAADRGKSKRDEHDRPLAGRVVVLDPGHQLGNGAFPEEISEPVDAGGFTKPCNTTGTSSDAGYPEATFTWEVARRTQRLLERAGARVLLTRDSNSADAWGPCVDERGRAGNPGQPGPTADLKISIHADGTYAAGAHGFHVVVPADVTGYTDDIAEDSADLAVVVRDALVREGFEVSSYTGVDGLDVRADLGTLNLADVPTVLLEAGNMRDPVEAAVLASPEGQRRYAESLSEAIRRFLER